MPLVVFCSVLLAIMWLVGGIMARQWMESVREKNMQARRQRELGRLREELRRSLVEHSQGRRSTLTDHLEAHELSSEQE
jgi:transposase